MKPLHLFLFITLHCISFSAFAADGVDNSYVDNGANELDIFVNNNSRAVMFGPGVHTAFGPPYFIVINNNAPAYDLGTVTQLSFTFCSSKMLSAYLDRVGSARFYYRIYLESQQGNPPPYSFVNLSSNNNLDPNTCFTSRQNSTWEAPLSVNVLNGLGSGAYLIEFYMEAQLYDVGDESMGCPVNAPAQCSIPDPHYGRVLRSRFNTTDPSACNYSAILNSQAPATRMKFYTGVQPPPMVLNSSATNVSCFGGNNGTASVAVSGGTSPYNYLWNNGQNTANISGLAAGNYTVTVTDAGNSTATATSTVTQPTALLASTSATNVNCFGGTNGTATATPTGGTAPYTYFWSNGQTTATINGLASGTYTVTVTDSKSCTKTSAANITQPTALGASTSATNVNCFGGTNGTATATPTGGTAPYTYFWSNGQTTATINGLASGTYTVTVTDAKSCTKTSAATITQPTALVASTSATNVSCFGGTNGTATATPTGGTAPYTYLWSNGQTTATINGLASDTYTVTVTDAKSCTKTSAANITQPTALEASTSATDVSCFGGTNGTATATPTGGTAPYTYFWSNGQTTATINGLASGTYTVTVTDAKSCTKTSAATVTQPTAFLVSTSATNVNCFGGTNGTATATPTGGTAPYSYLWSNGETTGIISGLSAATYTVTVTDVNDCTTTATATVEQPAALSAVGSATDVNCFGGADGTATATPTGGTAPYTYLWSNGETTGIISGLSAATYTVTVTDVNDCTTTATATVEQPAAALSAGASATDVNCFGGTDGTATATPTGGTAPYTYLWSNGETTGIISGLSAATYTVTVTDANDCTTTATATVEQPAATLSAGASATDVNCFGGADGTATATPTGGTAPYTYLWSNGETTGIISGLSAATYTVTVTDTNDCTTTATATVEQPAALSAGASATNVNCFGGTDGTATATPTGGTAPYTYLWSNGETTGIISGLSAATYTVTVTDTNDCTTTATATVEQPAALSAGASATNVNCFGGTDGTATATPTGGTAPYTYLWSNGETTGIISGLSAATYTVTVTDAKDCTAIEDITLTEPAMALSLEISSTPESCTIGSDGSATVTASGGTGPYGYIWSNGQTAQSATDLTAEDYTVTVTDANMCTSTATATVILGAVEDMKVHTWVKVFLQGPYVSAAGLMQDSLRAKGLIPLTEPYSGISGFTHVGGGGETMDQGVLDVTGPDAVVDWVFLELRTANMPSQVVATRSALLQRDGDVVDTDGQSPVVFDKEAGTAYYIAVRHRNHLGVQVGDPVLYPVCEVVETNFTELAEEDSYSYSGTNDAQRFAGNKHQMWAGNGRVDFQLKYNGSVNDRNAILNIVGINTPSNIVSGYLLADYNMDGQVKYNGAANDRNVLLGNVGIGTPSNVLNDQMAR